MLSMVIDPAGGKAAASGVDLNLHGYSVKHYTNCYYQSYDPADPPGTE